MKVSFVKDIWSYAYLSDMLTTMNKLKIVKYSEWNYYDDFHGDFMHMTVWK